MKVEWPTRLEALEVIILIFLGLFFFGLIVLSFPPHQPRLVNSSQSLYKAHRIGQALRAYANKHEGHFPEGTTSTQVCQILIDQSYLSDPTILYVALPGKVPAEGKHLKPENVGWDITAGLDLESSEKLPIVFLHGFHFVYEPDASAIPDHLLTPHDKTIGRDAFGAFMAVCYNKNQARIIQANEDGTIPKFIPADFDPKGKTYRQLTP